MAASNLWADSNRNYLVLPGLKVDQNTLRRARVRSKWDTAPHMPPHSTASKKDKDWWNGKIDCASIFATNLLGTRCWPLPAHPRAVGCRPRNASGAEQLLQDVSSGGWAGRL